jgi:hypothetical protein
MLFDVFWSINWRARKKNLPNNMPRSPEPRPQLQTLQDAGDFVREQHAELLGYVTKGIMKPFRLAEMIEGTKIESLPFVRHPSAIGAELATTIWAQDHQVFSQKYAGGSLTMGAFLHPLGPSEFVRDDHESPLFDRLVAILKTYALLFYFDDRIGNDRLKFVPPGQKTGKIQEQYIILSGLTQLFRTPVKELSTLAPPAHHAVAATLDVLRELQRLSDPTWFQNFFISLQKHLAAALTPHNHQHYTYPEFQVVRNDVAGMWLSVEFCELASGLYVDWKHIPLHVGVIFTEISQRAAWIGSLSNDLFSFHKEVILSLDGFNVIPILILNNHASNLMNAIWEAIRLTKVEIVAFEKSVAGARQVLNSASSRSIDSAQRVALHAYIRQAEAIVHASWAWQLATDRYTNPDEPSIFLETDRKYREQNGYYGKLKLAQPYE